LRLPTLARNQACDWLMPSYGRQPQRTDVQVVAAGGGVVLSVYDSTPGPVPYYGFHMVSASNLLRDYVWNVIRMDYVDDDPSI